jgi:hypothetical protein
MTNEVETLGKKSEELAVPVLNPLTGELIPLDDLRKVADAIEEMRAAVARINYLKDLLTDALAEHSRKIGTKTFSVGGRTVVMSADKELVWDIDYLDQALTEAGLPLDRLRSLITTTVSYKVNAAVANQIAAANPEYAEIIERAKSYVPKRQYASLRPITEVQK